MFIFKLILSLLSPFFYLKLKFASNPQVIVITLHEVDLKNWQKVHRLLVLIKNNFGFLKPGEFQDFIQGDFQFSGVKFLLTFDDGFSSAADFGLKALSDLDIKAVYFICPSYVELAGSDVEQIKNFIKEHLFLGKDGYYQSFREPLSWSLAKELVENGHLLTSHTLSHPVLSGLDEEAMIKELEGAKEVIKKKLGVESNWFAFPFGGLQFIDSTGMKQIRRVYQNNFSGLRGVVTESTSKYAIPRCSVDINSPFIMMFGEVVGVTNFLHYKKSKKLEEMLTT